MINDDDPLKPDTAFMVFGLSIIGMLPFMIILSPFWEHEIARLGAVLGGILLGITASTVIARMDEKAFKKRTGLTYEEARIKRGPRRRK